MNDLIANDFGIIMLAVAPRAQDGALWSITYGPGPVPEFEVTGFERCEAVPVEPVHASPTGAFQSVIRCRSEGQSLSEPAQLGWKPLETFETGIRKTVQWYLDNPEWVANVQSGGYRDWVSKQYGS